MSDSHQQLSALRDQFLEMGQTNPGIRVAMFIAPADPRPSPDQYNACMPVVGDRQPVVDGFGVQSGTNVIHFVYFGSCSPSVLHDFKGLAVTTLGYLFGLDGGAQIIDAPLPRRLTHEHWVMMLFSQGFLIGGPRFVSRLWFFVPPGGSVDYLGTPLHIPNLLWAVVEPKLRSLLRQKGAFDVDPLRQDEVALLIDGPGTSVAACSFQNNPFTLSGWLIDALLSQPVDSAGSNAPVTASADADKLMIDKSSFTVHYKGNSCKLGNTIGFKLIDRLARRPGTYVSVEALQEDVWEGERRTRGAIKSAVSKLRQALDDSEIALAIDGAQQGHYRLILS